MSPRRLLRGSWYRVHLPSFAIIVGLIIVLSGVFKVYELATQAHKAICALRAERIRGIIQGRTFLNKHPDGIEFRDANGNLVKITRADMLADIKRQKETVRAFRFADCGAFHDEDGGP